MRSPPCRGRSYRDIAEKYGVPLGTVKSRAARAMHAVRLAAGD
jgi:DNA-directed RNA polymerase specialized sigma24 family protein